MITVSETKSASALPHSFKSILFLEAMNQVGKIMTRPAKVITMSHTTLRKIAQPVTDDFIKSATAAKFINTMFSTLKTMDDGVIYYSQYAYDL